jgi:hypothetical protein
MARVGEIASVIGTADNARVLLGQYLIVLNSAYKLVDVSGGGSETVNREYLDGIRIRAEADYNALPASGDLDEQTKRQIAFDCASIESASGVTLSTAGKSSGIEDFASGITDLWDEAKKRANDLAKDLIPWWVYAIAIGLLVLFVVVKAKS